MKRGACSNLRITRPSLRSWRRCGVNSAMPAQPAALLKQSWKRSNDEGHPPALPLPPPLQSVGSARVRLDDHLFHHDDGHDRTGSADLRHRSHAAYGSCTGTALDFGEAAWGRAPVAAIANLARGAREETSP